MVLVRNEVSEKRIASIIKEERFSELGMLAVTSISVTAFVILISLIIATL
jgi:hypothetical protein